MDATPSFPSTIGATYVEPSADKVLEPGQKIGDLFKRNMTSRMSYSVCLSGPGGSSRSTTAPSSTSVTAGS